MCWSASQVYVCDARAPSAGRRFCVEQLGAALSEGRGREDLIYDAALVVSELLTNSIRAQSGITRLSLAVHRDLMRIIVDDDAPGLPRIRATRNADTTGRGMAIVASIASNWSVERLIPGKQVWAELDVPPELTIDLPSCHRPIRFRPSIDMNPADAFTAEPLATLPPAEL
jgi:anti-sigma regulatory factor (Ser/Thr protein kinase)